MAGKATAEANLRKAEAEFKRVQDLFRNHLVSGSAFDEAQAAYDVAKAQLTSAEHQVEMARASLASAEEALAKTTIVAPLTGTISKLNSEVGERVVGTATMAGTEVMTIADLNEMEARVDIGESDVVLIAPGQKARLEVDAFKDTKFNGAVTEIGNSSKGATMQNNFGSQSQEATKFEVRIRIKEKERFRPGMSVSAEIETRSRTNVLAVPIASVTTRLPKEQAKKSDTKASSVDDPPPTQTTTAKTNSSSAITNSPATNGTDTAKADKNSKEAAKPVEVVFVLEGERVKQVPVKLGISDDSHLEIAEGLQEGQEVISGGYRAISRDLEDGKKVRKGAVGKDKEKEGEGKKAEE